MSSAREDCGNRVIGRLAALILLCALSVIQSAELPQQISLTVAEVGGNVTLTCLVSDTGGKHFQLCKQPLGYMVQTVAALVFDKVKVSEQFKGSRFTVTKEEAQFLLTIRNVSKEDEATYFCQSGTSYEQTFINGTFLAVNDHNQQKHVCVKQSPETASVQLGDAVTLQCSLLSKDKENRVQCPGEHSVHWFTAGSGGFHPGIIYTHRNRSDEQEERSCVYSLSRTIQDSSDTGTYYCAVVTCGEILFGEGTHLEADLRSEPGTTVLVLGVLLVCCVILIAVLTIDIYRRKDCEHCKGARSVSILLGCDKSTMDHSNDLDGEKEVNYGVLDFSTNRVKRGKKKSESPQECVYSAVRAHYHNQQHPSL